MDTMSIILIVDDEAIGRETLAALLAGHAYQLVFASTGTDALAAALAHRPDLILLDVMLPGMDGFEVCRRLRAAPLLAEVPIILVTALDDRDARLRGIAAGADDFMTKPFDRVELQARVLTITRLNRYRQLLLARSRLDRLIELAPHGLLIVDGTGTIALVNPAMLRLLGAEQDAVLGTHVRAVVVPEQLTRCSAWLAHVIADPAHRAHGEIICVRWNGEHFPAELDAGYVEWNDQPAVQVIIRDITDRKRAELLEAERRRIAYDLHDGLAQIVTSTHQFLQALAYRYHPRSPQARTYLEQAQELAHRAVGEVRQIIAGLRPTALDDFGLATALEMQVEALCAEGWAISYETTLGAERLPPMIETALFRIAQEALTNVRKHAGTTRVRLALECQGPTVRLEVQDWGCGFQPSPAVGSAGLGERVGLRGMRDRVMLLGGTCHIQSQLGSGTWVVVEVPLPTPAQGTVRLTRQ